MEKGLFSGNIKGFSRIVNILLVIGSCLIVVGVGLFLFAYINKDDGVKQSITFLNEKIKLKIGEKIQLDVEVVPGDAKIKWSSNNLNVSVDENGIVMAKEEGNSIVYASIEDGPTAKCEITVTDDEDNKPIEKKVSISISPKNKTIKVGELLQLIADVSGGDDTVEWTSSNTSVATVSAEGLVKAIAPGEVSIRALVDGVEDETIITIISDEEKTDSTNTDELIVGKQFKTDYVKLSTTSIIVEKGQTATFDIEMINAAGVVSFTPNDLSIVTVSDNQTWMESSNNKDVDKQTFTITGNKTGSAVIVVNLADVATYDTVESLSERAAIIVTVK